MDLREANREDVRGIRVVARRSWETDYPAILSRETIVETVEEWYSPERLGFDTESDDAHVIVADEHGVVGFAHAVVENGVGTLLRLYVDPDHRGRGVGMELVTATREALVAEGCERLEAMVLEKNEPGNAFYRELGFEPVRERETTIGGESHAEVVHALTL